MKRTSVSLEWKVFWALIGIISIAIFVIILSVVRQQLFTNDILEKGWKCWKPKLSRLLSVVKSDSRTTHIDYNNSDVVIQRAVYCIPNVLQNNDSEVNLKNNVSTFPFYIDSDLFEVL